MKNYTTVLLISIACMLMGICYGQQKPNELSMSFGLMEAQIQKASNMHCNKARRYYTEVEGEIRATRGSDQQMKRDRLNYVLQKMDSINAETEELIAYIDQVKLDLLAASMEDTVSGSSIVVQERDEFEPMRLSLAGLTNPTNRIEVIDSIGFYREIVGYRNRLIQLCGNYQWGGNTYHVEEIGTMYWSKNSVDLVNKLNVELSKVYNAVSVEDKTVLIDLYLGLYQTGENWIYLRPTSLLINLCVLSTIEQDVLAANALALAHWKSKVSTGEYTFNELLTIVDGPELIKKNSEASYKVSFAAIDRDQENEVKVESPENVKVTYNEEGVASFKLLNPSVGVHTIKGTITVRNKSGVRREEPWEKTIEVLP